MMELTKIRVMQDYNGIPEGSVFYALPINIEGEIYWSGDWACMAGTSFIEVPEAFCEKWIEEKHDPLFFIKQHLEKEGAKLAEQQERAELARLKEKYEK